MKPNDVYPFIKLLVSPDRNGSGFMLPKGVTVHYSADRNVERFLKALQDKGLAYHLIIDRDGSSIQMAYFSHTVDHAGKARWIGRSPNRAHIAVSLVSWGKLDETGRSWNKSYVPPQEISERASNVSKFVCKWDSATPEQEKTLAEFLVWACREFKIEPQEICGHDECAIPPGRKEDPGGVLSMSMIDLRREIARKLSESAKVS